MVSYPLESKPSSFRDTPVLGAVKTRSDGPGRCEAASTIWRVLWTASHGAEHKETGVPTGCLSRQWLPLLLLLTGCVSYSLNDLPQVPREQLPRFISPYPLTAKVSGAAYQESPGGAAQALYHDPRWAKTSAVLSQRVFKFLERSGMFRDVVLDQNVVYDVAIEVRLILPNDPQARSRARWLRFLSTVTATAVPVWVTEPLTLELTAKSSKGNLIFQHRYRERVRTVVWLPVLGLLLFRSPDPGEALRNAGRLAYRDFTVEFNDYAQKQGYRTRGF